MRGEITYLFYSAILQNNIGGEVMKKMSVPDIQKAKKILVVQAHYDDTDISIGGTLADLSENGADLIYLTVTDDLVGVVDQSLTEEQMSFQLKNEQKEAGRIIGVNKHYWLGYPDAGKYDYYNVRNDIVKYIRILEPDFIVTLDPWLPYEAHKDHIKTGEAASEAAILYNFTRIKTEPEVDEEFEPFELKGIAFHNSANSNIVYNIDRTMEKKHEAIDKYRAQFTEESMKSLHEKVKELDKLCADNEDFTYGEPLNITKTKYLHGFTLGRNL